MIVRERGERRFISINAGRQSLEFDTTTLNELNSPRSLAYESDLLMTSEAEYRMVKRNAAAIGWAFSKAWRHGSFNTFVPCVMVKSIKIAV
jgi:hypothetical protein